MLPKSYIINLRIFKKKKNLNKVNIKYIKHFL